MQEVSLRSGHSNRGGRSISDTRASRPSRGCMTALSEAGPAVTTECPDQGNEFKRQFRVTFFSARIASLPGAVGTTACTPGRKAHRRPVAGTKISRASKQLITLPFSLDPDQGKRRLAQRKPGSALQAGCRGFESPPLHFVALRSAAPPCPRPNRIAGRLRRSSGASIPAAPLHFSRCVFALRTILIA